MRPIASDLTDTYDTHPEIRGEVSFIITANTWRTWEKVRENADDLPVYLNPGKEELMDIVNHKARVINQMNVQKYYEDQSEQVALLKAMCPNCRIVLVKEGLTAI
jgi:hypothetical protein